MRQYFFSRRIGFVMAVFGLLMMVYGVYRGEVEVLFTKAVNICMECVGIG